MGKLQELADTLGIAIQNLETISKGIDTRLVTNVEVEGIDFADYPDFCDAYVSNCWYKGRPATDMEVEMINNDSDFVYQQTLKAIF